MKVCQRCGANCADDAAFCGNCGYNFVCEQNGANNWGKDYSTNPYQNNSPHNNPMAVASMVLGILSLVLMCYKGFGGIPGILAIIFGAVSRFSIRKSGGRETGMGFSTSGLTMGIISVSLIVAVVLIAIIFGITALSLMGL